MSKDFVTEFVSVVIFLGTIVVYGANPFQYNWTV